MDTNWNGGLLAYHVDLANNILRYGKLITNENYIAALQKANARTKLADIEKFKYEYSNKDLVHPAYTRNPGYGIMLAATFKAFGYKKYIYLRILQILIDGLFIYLIFVFVNRIFSNRKAALLSSFLYSIYLPIVFLSGYAAEDIWGIWGCLLFLYFGLKPRKKYYPIIGTVFMALTSYVSQLPITLFQYLFVFYTLYLLIYYYKIEKFKSIISTLLICICTIVSFNAVVYPYFHRNYKLFNMKIGMRHYGNLADIGSLGEFDKDFFALDDRVVCAGLDKAATEKGITRADPRYWDGLKDEYNKYLREHPGIKIKNAFKRIPKLILAQQFYGIERLFKGYLINRSKEKLSRLQAATKYPALYMFKVIKLIVVIFRIIALLLLAYYLIKKRNIEIFVLSITCFLILGGALYSHVEAKYILLPEIIGIFIISKYIIEKCSARI